MGCTSTVMVESRKVVPLPPQTINAYIDKFPAIILLKIKEKFDALTAPNKELTLQSFLKLYSSSKVTEDLQRRLFLYFTDGQQSMKFRQFMVKYATIVKCDSSIFCNILFELYKETIERDHMNQVQFTSFVKSETERLLTQPPLPTFPISLQVFTEWVIQAQLSIESYQNDLLITTEQDFPFQLINKELAQCDYNDFIPGNDYYLLSNSWYYRWAFYYQDSDHPPEMPAIKSTKMLPLESWGRRSKRRDSIKMTDSVRSSEVGTALVEQPRNIEFEDIEGEYRYELKKNLKISAQVKVVSQTLWRLLTNLHPTQQTFKRKALNADTLQYYPKAIYFIQTNEKGRFLGETMQIKLLPNFQRIFSLRGKNTAIFIRNFGQEWKQVETDQSLAEVSLQPRFFMAVTPNRTNFLQNTVRKQLNNANLQVGDRVFAPFALGGSAQAEIVGVRDQHMFKVHFKGYSYRYEYQVHRDDLSVMPEKDLPKRKTQGILKGIANVGNTCFINSILQCLVATPVLQDFLKNYAFSQKKEPFGYALSSVVKALLNNERPSPQQFKRMIDLHLPQFSGFDQHDAQEFLIALLDKLNEEITEKPTVIDNLFGGKVGSQLTCCSCEAVKNIEEKMYILSLPIPEAEFNYFSIIIVPLTSKVVRKVVLKLSRKAVVADYCTAFEERSNASRKDFLFVETLFGSLKKMKTQITNPLLQNKNATQVGILPNVSLLAFEKMPLQFYLQLLNSKSQSQYRDFQLKSQVKLRQLSQAAWTICKIVEEKNIMKVEYISAEGEIEKINIENSAFAEQSGKLGSKSDISYKKIILRKYNTSLKRLQNFGLQLLAGVPKWASYNDLLTITERYMLNFKKDPKIFAQHSKADFVVRFIDPTKGKCIFCEKQCLSAAVEKDEVRACCEVSDKDAPIAWVAKSKNFWFYVDWIDLSNCHIAFSTVIDIDPVSKAVQNSRQEVAISLQACMKLHSEAQRVEMQCDRCKEKYQKLQHTLPAMPNILVVHMKQFRYTSQGQLVKLDVRLKWQEFLDAKHALSGGKLYQLYALVKHSGNSQSGHYTCMAKRKHPIQNRKVWVHFDDDNATVTRQEQKFIDDAYLLFYKKVDMPSSSLVIYSDLNSH